MEILNKSTITSLELLNQINIFRKEEGTKVTNHKDLLIIIETEFTDINRKRVEGGVCPKTVASITQQLKEECIEISSYIHPQNKQEYPLYILGTAQAKQCLLKESKVVRKAVIKYIDELEKQLMTQTPKLPTTYLEALEQLVEREKLLVEQAPKVDYYNKVLDSESSFTTTQIAKEIEMSAIQLNVLLSNLGVQFKQSGQWMLTAKYQDKGYTKTRTHTLPDGNTRHSTTWTEKGRQFILELSEGF